MYLSFKHNSEQWVWIEYSLFTNRPMSNIILSTYKSYEASTLQYSFRLGLFPHSRQRHVSVKCLPNPKRTQNVSGCSSTVIQRCNNLQKLNMPLKRAKEFLKFSPHLFTKKYIVFQFLFITYCIYRKSRFSWANLSWNTYAINLVCLKYNLLNVSFYLL